MSAVSGMSDAPKAVAYFIAAGVLILGGMAAVLWLLLQFDPTQRQWWAWLWRYYQATGTLPPAVIYTAGGGLVALVAALALCPWSMADRRYGDAAWAIGGEIRKMKPGVTDRAGVVLGETEAIWPLRGRLLMSSAPLSLLVAAPAGTGKTAGIVVPSVLMSDDASLIVNDPKGEVYEETAGHRAKLGPVLRIEWNAGTAGSACWNPLSLGSLPADGPGRGDAIDRMVAILIEGEESNFFVSAPRAALSAWLLYEVYRAEEDDSDPSIADALHNLANLAADVDERVDAKSNDEDGEGEAGEDGLIDEIGLALEKRANYAEVQGWPRRVVSGLRQLGGYDHRTRSNILGTINASLRVFANDNVAAVTSRSDFDLPDLRGISGKPLTVYIVVPAFDQEAFGKVTSLFVESATRYLTEKRPAKDEWPVRFILDEVAFLQPMKAISMGPAITRGYRVSFLFACQDFGQLEAKWGKGGLDNILSNTAFKVVLTQNHPGTAKWFSEAIGYQTMRKRTKSWQNRLSGDFGQTSRSEAGEGLPLIRPEEISSLRFGRQLILCQGQYKRPIKAQSGYWKRHATMRRRAKIPAPPIPGTLPKEAESKSALCA